MQGYHPKDGKYAPIEEVKGGPNTPVARSQTSLLMWPERLPGEDYSTYWTRRLQAQRLAYRVRHGTVVHDVTAEGTYENRAPKDDQRDDAIKHLGRRRGIKLTKATRRFQRQAARQMGAA